MKSFDENKLNSVQYMPFGQTIYQSMTDKAATFTYKYTI